YPFQFTGDLLVDDDLPLPWWHVPNEDRPDIDVEQQQALIADALQKWQDAVPCVDLAGGYQGQATMDGSYDDADGRNTVRFDDPDHITSSNIPSTTYIMPTAEYVGSMLIGSTTQGFYRPLSLDMVWSESWTLVEPGDACDPNAMQAIGQVAALRETGFLLGLTANCNEYSPFGACTDQERAAVMYTEAGPCDADRLAPGWDDVRGLTALYTPIGVPTEMDMPTIALGEELCWQRSAVFDAYLPVTWSLSDGTEYETAELCHTFAEPGYYHVDLSWEGCEAPTWAEALVCEVPGPPTGEDQMFTATVDGDTLRLSLLDVVVDERCLNGVDWAVTSPAGDTEHAWTTEASFTVEPGTWTIELTALGVVGDATDTMEITVDSASDSGGDGGGGAGCGCQETTMPTGMAGLLAALLPGLIALRRRRRGGLSVRGRTQHGGASTQ
ncbi:MAG: hypothetical protein GXP62_08735, partial [Oligoflexia bacterium]|nr:hypothetical protein [Oligoflexia bacterium]